jgi:hypothetical protein
MKLTEVVKPITESINTVMTDVGQKYNNSTNQIVKTVRGIFAEIQSLRKKLKILLMRDITQNRSRASK